jgi:hypothetical protein
MSELPVASISMDLDNLWAYLKTHGDEDWKSWPGYLDVAVPRFLDFLERRKLKITVFVVGQDAVLEQNGPALRQIAEAGHEIGNHSFHHEPWLHLYSRDQLQEEIRRSEDAIHAVTGQRPVGFRGPGFSYCNELLEILAERNYLYDGSTFPTFVGPLARTYYFLKSQLDRQQKEERKQLFGKWADGFRSNKPFFWNIGTRQLLEIPVTTMPLFKAPIHASYIFFLAGYSPWLARTWFGMAMQLCRLASVAPSFLLHPLDFMDVNDVPRLDFFPGMKLDANRKIALLNDCLAIMQRYWRPGTMRVHAESAMSQPLGERHVTATRLMTS